MILFRNCIAHSGDYAWVVSAGTVGESEVLLSQAVELPCVVERKTLQDLVNRSFVGDHLTQMARLRAANDVIKHGFLLIEGNPNTTANHRL